MLEGRAVASLLGVLGKSLVHALPLDEVFVLLKFGHGVLGRERDGFACASRHGVARSRVLKPRKERDGFVTITDCTEH